MENQELDSMAKMHAANITKIDILKNHISKVTILFKDKSTVSFDLIFDPTFHPTGENTDATNFVKDLEGFQLFEDDYRFLFKDGTTSHYFMKYP